MTRSWFGGTGGDFVAKLFALGSSKLFAQSDTDIEAWTDLASRGGRKITDLLDRDGGARTTVPETSPGQADLFQAEDGINDRVLLTIDGGLTGVWSLNSDGIAAADARDAAQVAQAGAETAQSAAEAAAAQAAAPTAEQMAIVAADPTSDFAKQQAAAFVTQGGGNVVPTFSGTQANEWLKVVNASDNSTMHLIAAAGFTGPELLGLGVNCDGAKGLVSDVTNPGAKGAQISLFSGDDATSEGLNLNANAGSKGSLLVVNTFGATGLGFDLHAQGTPAAGQVLAKWRTDALAARGYFGVTLMQVYADTGTIDFTAPLLRAHGATLSVMTSDLSNTGNMDRVDIVNGNTGTPYVALRKFSGTAGKFFSQRINPTGAAGATLDAATGAFVPGGETWATALKWGMSGGLPTLALYGGTARTQPARKGQLTDSSGGTSGGNTIAAVTDFPSTANAVATLAAKVNAIEAVLSAAGGGIGVTA